MFFQNYLLFLQKKFQKRKVVVPLCKLESTVWALLKALLQITFLLSFEGLLFVEPTSKVMN
jgi:hypothetical protein